ncbi:MAG TPA: hypothetical protein VFY64_02385 [Nitrososphaeraceae archaeon]|nr:hypothetical protein [Nitrososphaeraceae archaeon]
MLEGKIYFHEDIVVLNDDEITFVSNSIVFKHTVKEVNVSNDVINDIVFLPFCSSPFRIVNNH